MKSVLSFHSSVGPGVYISFSFQLGDVWIHNVIIIRQCKCLEMCGKLSYHVSSFQAEWSRCTVTVFLIMYCFPFEKNRILMLHNSNNVFYWLLFRLNKLHKSYVRAGFKIFLGFFFFPCLSDVLSDGLEVC